MFDVVLFTRGDSLVGTLASIVRFAPFDLRIITAHPITDKASGMLLLTLKHLGCHVDIEPDQGKGIGQARAQAFANARAPVLVCLDDDVVLDGEVALLSLALAATNYDFACPIIRYVQNFYEKVIPGHTEIWAEVKPDDPRVLKALAAQGGGWRRVYNVGKPVETDRLGGSCFAIRTDLARRSVDLLREWPNGLGGEDGVIGMKAGGRGIALNAIVAYHFGRFTFQEWGLDTLGDEMVRRYPEEAIRTWQMLHAPRT